MAGRFEGNPTIYYSKLFSQLGNTPSLTSEITENFLRMRKKCLGELTDMQQLTEQLKPTPDFLTYRGAVDTRSDGSRWICHSSRNTSFTRAIMQMSQAYNEGGFTADATNQIVLADVNALIPAVIQFTPVLESGKLNKLAEDHPGVKLYSLAHKVIENIANGGGSIEDIIFMLAEGVNEPIDKISTILAR